MTVKEFCQRCDEILIERAITLKEWQIADIKLYKHVVRVTNRVTSVDEYYLKIVGVPYSGPVVKPVKRVGEKINAKQEKLF